MLRRPFGCQFAILVLLFATAEAQASSKPSEAELAAITARGVLLAWSLGQRSVSSVRGLSRQARERASYLKPGSGFEQITWTEGRRARVDKKTDGAWMTFLTPLRLEA